MTMAPTDNIAGRILEQRRKESGCHDIDMSDFLDGAAKKARDHARLPMQVGLNVICYAHSS